MCKFQGSFSSEEKSVTNMTIPSTITTEDKNAEIKKLSEQIAILKSAKESAERETRSAIAGADAMVERIKKQKEEIKEFDIIRQNASRDTSEFMTLCLRIIRDSGAKMREMVETARLLDKSRENASQALIYAKNEAKTIHENAVSEELGLQRRKEDLDIYYERLKSYFAEHLPDQKIIL